jgi:hypothetical protein
MVALARGRKIRSNAGKLTALIRRPHALPSRRRLVYCAAQLTGGHNGRAAPSHSRHLRVLKHQRDAIRAAPVVRQ